MVIRYFQGKNDIERILGGQSWGIIEPASQVQCLHRASLEQVLHVLRAMNFGKLSFAPPLLQ